MRKLIQLKKLKQYFLNILRCRVCWQITLSIFICSLVVATVTVLLTYRQYEKINYLETQKVGFVIAKSFFDVASPNLSSNQLLAQMAKLQKSTSLVGIVVYNRDGLLLGDAGNLPFLRFANLSKQDLEDPFPRLHEKKWLDVIWTPEQLQAPYYLAMRLDVSAANQHMLSFFNFLRNTLITITILTTLLGLFVIAIQLLTPLLRLKKFLTAASLHPGKANRFQMKNHLNNELGQIIQNFNQLMFSVARNISELHAKEKELNALKVILENKLGETQTQLTQVSTHDSLTHLPNRQLFIDLLEKALDKNQHSAILLFGMADFAVIKNVLGDADSNNLIKQCATYLLALPEKNIIRGRISENEFAIALIDMPKKDITHFIHSLQQKISGKYFLHEHELTIRFVMGVSLFPTDATTPEALLRCSSIALYHSALLETNQTHHFYSPQLLEAYENQRKILIALETALANNEFSLVYQPQFKIGENTPYGVEALIRWHHPQYGMIPPKLFIPLSEKSPHFIKIGEWIIQTACQQAKKWEILYGVTLQIAINLSARQLKSPEVIENIQGILQGCKIQPAQIELEITESQIIQDPQEAIQKLQQLRNLGISLAIDDFGTGYSSFSYLQQLPISRIKIDKSFIDDIHTNPETQSIVKSIIQVGHELDLLVLAEGVENIEQLAVLKKLHCDEVQGYLFSTPLIEKDFKEKYLISSPL